MSESVCLCDDLHPPRPYEGDPGGTMDNILVAWNFVRWFCSLDCEGRLALFQNVGGLAVTVRSGADDVPCGCNVGYRRWITWPSICDMCACLKVLGETVPGDPFDVRPFDTQVIIRRRAVDCVVKNVEGWVRWLEKDPVACQAFFDFTTSLEPPVS